ncbi:RNA-binding protein [Flavihumibacter sp. R14]|nr:RNA-binding protein [Flavihumibacter soli]
MIHIGTYNYLKVKSITPEGLILTDGEQDVILPESQDAQVGDELFVFVYHHKDGRIMATGKRPYAAVGDFAYLKVVDETENGSFMDIGIDKDLFVPASKQEQPLQLGKKYVVYLYVDQHDGKLTATTWLDDKVDTDLSDLEEGDEVSLLICDTSELGYSAIINNKYMGLLYRNEVYEELNIGESRVGYIKKIRPEDNKVDLSLRPLGFDFILDSRDSLLDILKETGGVLALGDKSSPDDIRQQLKMSKKAFKQVIGGLYKQRLITISDYEIRLVPQQHDPHAD